MRLTAAFPTARGPQLLATLSEPFAHKISVETHEDRTLYDFNPCHAVVKPTPDGLRLTAEAGQPEGLDRIRGVPESHLLRFADREDPQPQTCRYA